MCCQPLPPSLSIMALEEYGYQSRRGIRDETGVPLQPETPRMKSRARTNTMILPSISAPEHNILKLLEESGMKKQEPCQMHTRAWKLPEKHATSPIHKKDFPIISAKELYTPSFEPPGVVYEDLSYRKRLMRADELYKFSDGTLKKVRDTLHHRLHNFRLGYNKDMPRRKWKTTD
ncbi:hypothetical protein Tco_0351146 [Tanacetum coccineum]